MPVDETRWPGPYEEPTLEDAFASFAKVYVSTTGPRRGMIDIHERMELFAKTMGEAGSSIAKSFSVPGPLVFHTTGPATVHLEIVNKSPVGWDDPLSDPLGDMIDMAQKAHDSWGHDYAREKHELPPMKNKGPRGRSGFDRRGKKRF